jgi:hypothetical protein
MRTGDKTNILSVRVTEEQKASIWRVAKLSKQQPSQVVRQIIEDWLKG